MMAPGEPSKSSFRKKEDFEIGDEVVMNEKANKRYGITTEGSEGEIVRIHGSKLQIKFYKITGFKDYPVPTDFDVDKKYVDHAGKNSVQQLELEKRLQEEREEREKKQKETDVYSALCDWKPE